MTDAHDPLAPLIEEFLERTQRGERPTVAEYAQRYPELADELRELLPMVVTLEEAKAPAGASSGAVVGPVPVEQLGDYRLLREIGRGGMGVVCEAEQQSLGRRVAVKVLPPQLLSEGRQVARFEREARTAARLHHTNIVPIFGVGSEDGYHYYVMQLIRGVGLDRVARELSQRRDGDGANATIASARDVLSVGRALAAELSGDATGASASDTLDAATQTRILDSATRAQPTADTNGPACTATRLRAGRDHWRSVAQIGLQVADALAYAHAQGTLHRDIKPANLLLDTDGTVWVADFGLARAIDQSALTQPGDVVGTLRYMAPEQFKGRSDPRSDIYSLGVTLYELAVLQPAFAAATRGELIDVIMAGRLTPPKMLGVHPPRDFETILLKAAAREPERRYASAGALADDLRRFLDDRPVRARRVTPVEQAWRWTRRNPTVAGLLGSVAVLLVAVATIASIGYWETRRANQRVQAALGGERAQRQRAEAVSDLALAALDTIFDALAPQPTAAALTATIDGDDEATVAIPVAPAVSTETAALLEHMLAFYEQLADQPGESDALLPRIAEANRRIGQIHQRLGEYDAAASAYARSRSLYVELAGREPNSPQIELALARLQIDAGQLHAAREDFVASRLAYADAYAALRASADAPRSSAWRFELARVCYLLAQEPRPAAPPPGVAGGPPPGRAEPGRPGFGPPPRGGGPPDAPGPPPGAAPPFNLRPAERRSPPGGWLAQLLPAPPPGAQGPRIPGALPTPMRVRLLGEATDLLDGLIAEHPGAPEYRRWLARCYGSWPADDASVAGPAPRTRAIEILSELAARYPQSAEYRFDLAQVLAAGHGPPARRSHGHADDLARARILFEALVAERPNVPEYVVGLVQTLERQARRALDAGDVKRAVDAFEDALGRQKMLSERFPDETPYVAGLALLEIGLAEARLAEGASDSAAELAAAARDRLQQRVEDDPNAAPFYVHGLRRHADRVLHLAQHDPPRGPDGRRPPNGRPPRERPRQRP